MSPSPSVGERMQAIHDWFSDFISDWLSKWRKILSPITKRRNQCQTRAIPKLYFEHLLENALVNALRKTAQCSQ